MISSASAGSTCCRAIQTVQQVAPDGCRELACRSPWRFEVRGNRSTRCAAAPRSSAHGSRAAPSAPGSGAPSGQSAGLDGFLHRKVARPARHRHGRGRTAGRRRRSTGRSRAARSACCARRRRPRWRAHRGSACSSASSRAMCFSVLILAAESRPSRPSRSARALRIASWWNGSNALLTRPQIAAALAVDSCWPQMIAAKPGRSGSRCRIAGMPVDSRIGRRRRSWIDQFVDGVVEVGLGFEMNSASAGSASPDGRRSCLGRHALWTLREVIRGDELPFDFGSAR